MFDVDYVVSHERYKDMKRDAENERLARQVQGYNNSALKNVRQALGRSLVVAGEYLAKER